MASYFRVFLLIIGISLFYQSNAQEDRKVSDTIPSFKANRQDQMVWGNPEMPDSSDILAEDTVNKIMVFMYGGPAYIAYYDKSNKGTWPDTSNWITWPLFDGERFGYIDREFSDPFHVNLQWLNISGKKLLQVDWSYSFKGNRVWTQEGGAQIWDLKTQTCYFDLETYSNIYSSGAGTETRESHEETCSIEMNNKKAKLNITKNTCDSFPRPGKYILAGDHLVRTK
ncbi:hypothetical protein [Polluticoccus soli]|uniref:hypothetical protein n=1 Tax=Polluticoccus soli TaxID=3034150 RepID=UPI0023E1110B|nr:hypothetical protein [Flavipsychrobacter sp. JY13-12]